ncbi:hypothetical protein D1007_32905 [Hordeum vulgare]|nr:hypothetical protein D1007_51398 [Hordeum vulgare]KAE8792602.1 hypothetical protein D1007_32905 [Hordeum vulgare]
MIPPPAPFGLSEPLSVAGDGSWRLSLIPEHTPVHLMLPVDDGKRRSSCPSTDLAGTSRGATLTRACPRSRADDSRPPPPSARVADGKYYYGMECPVPPAARFGSIDEFEGDSSSKSKGLLDTATMEDATSSTRPPA